MLMEVTIVWLKIVGVIGGVAGGIIFLYWAFNNVADWIEEQEFKIKIAIVILIALVCLYLIAFLAVGIKHMDDAYTERMKTSQDLR